MTRDGRTIYFASFRDGSSRQWVARRGRRDEKFTGPQRVFPEAEAGGESALSIAMDGTVFLAAGWPQTVGASDIWIASAPSVPLRSSDFVPVAAVNTMYSEFDPFPSPDGQRLYFGRRESAGSGRRRRRSRAARCSPDRRRLSRRVS